MLGCIAATRIAAVADSKSSYEVLAWVYSAICAASGASFLLLPSPRPPSPADVVGTASARRQGSKGFGIVLAGSALLLVVLGCFCAATTLTSSLPRKIEDSVLGYFYAANVASVLGSVVLARRLATWKALVLLFLIAAGSSALMVGAYLAPPGAGVTFWLLHASYCGLGTVMAAFPLLFAFVESLVRLTGSSTTVLAGGAALGPLLTAVLADLTPVALWLALSGCLAAGAAAVGLLHITCGGRRAACDCQQKEGLNEDIVEEDQELHP